MQAALLANVNRDPKVRPHPFALDDFLPSEPVDPPTPEEQLFADKARIDSLFSSMGGS